MNVNTTETAYDAARRFAGRLEYLREGLAARSATTSGDPVTDAFAFIDQLGYERRILGYARMILDRAAEYDRLSDPDRPILRREAADCAQRIVDEIGHPAADEPALGPSYRGRLAEAADAIHANLENGPWALIGDPGLRALVREYVADACHNIAVAAGLDGAMEAAHAACPVRLATALPTPTQEAPR